MIRYDLNALEKSTQLAIIQRVNEAGVMHVVTDGVLAIDEAAEETVDVIISAEEANERILSETQKNWNDVANGSKPPNCEICRSTPAAELTLRSQVGMIIVRSSRTFNAVLCRSCGTELRRKVQRETTLKGWTGIYSAALNPVYLATNEKNYRSFLSNLERWSS